MDYLVTSIDSILDDLMLLGKLSDVHKRSFEILIHSLRNLRIFVLLARKLVDEDSSLVSFLEKIDDAITENEEKISPYSDRVRKVPSQSRSNLEGGILVDLVSKVVQFWEDIESFTKEIDEWYTVLSDSSRKSSSCSSATDEEVTGVIDSLLGNLVDFLRLHSSAAEGSAAEALQEKLSFVKNFIRFTRARGIGHPQFQDLLARVEVVTMDAAHLSHTLCRFETGDEEWRKAMQLKISQLFEIKPSSDRQVYEAYTQALSSSKLSGRSRAHSADMKDDVDDDDDRITILKDFLDSLIFYLCEMLQLDPCLAVSVKDQLLVLYEGLRFLRIILRKQQNRFDDEVRDLTEVVICDAGIIIFSSSQEDVQMEHWILDLQGRIRHIGTEVGEEYPEMPAFSFSRTNELGFIDFVLEKLKELTSYVADSDAKRRFLTIQDDFAFLRSFLGEIADVRREQEELQALWNRIVEMAYRIESLIIDPWMDGHIPDSFVTSSDSITKDIGNIKTDSLNISGSQCEDIKKAMKVAGTLSNIPILQSRGLPKSDEVVGFDGEAILICNQLTMGTRGLRIVAIVGIPGIGKTTLATKVHNDPSVLVHFHICAACSISQVFDKRRVLLELLSGITRLSDKYHVMSEEDLAELIWRSLKQRKYLIFLDDIWDTHSWMQLAPLFPNDANGSRILLTSRIHNVAPRSMLVAEPLVLRQLTNNESWELMQIKLFPKGNCPPELIRLGMQIAESCEGIPLMVIVLAGILATLEWKDWRKVLESLTSGIISVAEQCKSKLELSYGHLPDHLKSCFLYLGLFPKDKEVSAKRMIQLWIAEGFVPKTTAKMLEDVASDYLMELVARSLVVTTKTRSTGGIKACNMCGLLRDFCKIKAKEENFFQLLRGYDEVFAFNETRNVRRLCIHSEPKHFKESRLLCPRVRSLLFFDHVEWFRRELDIAFIIHSFKILRVMDIMQINLGPVFPSDMEFLVQLEYLAVRGEMEVIPPSIGNLARLKALIVDSLKSMVSLPDTLWNLKRLRYLYIRNARNFTGFSLPLESLADSRHLDELDTFSGAITFWGSLERQMRKSPNIRKLKCKLFHCPDEKEKCKDNILALDFLFRLESLDVSSSNVVRDPTEFEFCFPLNLRRLTLSGFGLPWSKISSIGKLPNLQVLKLLDGSFVGETWDMDSGDEPQFQQLRFLKLESSDIVRWTASEGQLPIIEKLVFQSCYKLKEIPSSCLEWSPTLEMIEVHSCSDSFASPLQGIRAVQMDMGNSYLTILKVRDLGQTSQ